MTLIDKIKKAKDNAKKRFEEYIKRALAERPEVVYERGQGKLQILESNETVEETKEEGRLRVKMVSNQETENFLRLSGKAIKRVVEETELPLPMYLGHEKDLGVIGIWDKLTVEEKDGKVYGVFEGSLDLRKSLAKDVKIDIDDGLAIGASIGGYIKKVNEEGIVSELDLEEGSLTYTPANPDAVVNTSLTGKARGQYNKEKVKEVKKLKKEKMEKTQGAIDKFREEKEKLEAENKALKERLNKIEEGKKEARVNAILEGMDKEGKELWGSILMKADDKALTALEGKVKESKKVDGKAIDILAGEAKEAKKVVKESKSEVGKIRDYARENKLTYAQATKELREKGEIK